jgi:hypothetical protein
LGGQADQELVEINLEIQKLSVAALSKYLPKIIKTDLKTSLNGKLDLKFDPGTAQRQIRFAGQLKNCILEHWRLADHPIQGINFATDGLLDWNTQNKQIDIAQLKLDLNGLVSTVKGNLNYRDRVKLAANLTLPQTDLQRILGAIPKDFIPTIYQAKVKGSVQASLQIEMDLAHPSKLVFDPNIEIFDYELIQAPPQADLQKLKHPFRHVVRQDGKIVDEFTIGPANKNFVPFAELGDNIIAGVLTCEDGRFFRHNGFQVQHLRKSMVRNIKEKRFARGGSTITMQTVKNLFLSGQKNFSRKLEEIFLAYAIEQELDKERILEIYMNIIEWGPDIYGIGPAAKYYFEKEPEELTPLEAAYLGSIIANPNRYHYMYKRGEISDTWANYLAVILDKMDLKEEDDEDAAEDIDKDLDEDSDQDEDLDVDAEKWEAKTKYVDPATLEFGWVREKRLAEEQKASPENVKQEKENYQQ